MVSSITQHVKRVPPADLFKIAQAAGGQRPSAGACRPKQKRARTKKRAVKRPVKRKTGLGRGELFDVFAAPQPWACLSTREGESAAAQQENEDDDNQQCLGIHSWILRRPTTRRLYQIERSCRRASGGRVAAVVGAWLSRPSRGPLTPWHCQLEGPRAE